MGESECTLLQAGCPKNEGHLLLLAKTGVVSIETNLALDTVCGCWILELQDKLITTLLPSVLYEFGARLPLPARTSTTCHHQNRQLSKICKRFQKDIIGMPAVWFPNSIYLHWPSHPKVEQMRNNEEFWEKFRTLQDKHVFDTKKIGTTIYKKLLAFHQNAAQQMLTQRRQTAFF
ncbi:uncharacterized protein RBU33_017428 [Hipposideros larvatus]